MRRIGLKRVVNGLYRFDTGVQDILFKADEEEAQASIILTKMAEQRNDEDIDDGQEDDMDAREIVSGDVLRYYQHY